MNSLLFLQSVNYWSWIFQKMKTSMWKLGIRRLIDINTKLIKKDEDYKVLVDNDFYDNDLEIDKRV
jgi:hypothetical protein